MKVLLTTVLAACLTITSPVGAEGFSQKSMPHSCSSGNLTENDPANQELAEFLKALQSAVKRDDARVVARLISFPLLVSTAHGKYEVRSEKQLTRNYSRIFTPGVKRLILAQRPECLSRVGAQGFTIGHGELWFDIFPGQGIKIFSLTTEVLSDE